MFVFFMASLNQKRSTQSQHSETVNVKFDEKHGGCRSGPDQLFSEETRPRSCSRRHPFQHEVAPRPLCSCHKIGSLRWTMTTNDNEVVKVVKWTLPRKWMSNICYQSWWTIHMAAIQKVVIKQQGNQSEQQNQINHVLLKRDSSNSSCAASHSIASWMMASGLTFSRNEATLALTFGWVLRLWILGWAAQSDGCCHWHWQTLRKNGTTHDSQTMTK